MKIRTRVIIVIVSTNFLIILLSIFAGIGYFRKNVENYIETDMMVVADMADRFISSEIALLKNDAGIAAENLAETNPDDWNDILTQQMKSSQKFIGASVIDKETGVTHSAGEVPASSDVLSNNFIQKAFTGTKTFTSTMPTNKGVVFYLSVPIPETTEKVLAFTLDGMYFSDLSSEYHVWETGHIFIDDNEGYIIANIRQEWVQNRQNFILQAKEEPQYNDLTSVISKAIKGERGIDYYSLDGISRICAYRPITGSEEGWCLGIVAPLSESPIRDVDEGLILIAAVCFILSIIAAFVASGFIKKPYEEVAALKENAEADSQAKSSFLANMSHEIRTPLNAVVGLSELALDDCDFDGEMKETFEKIHSSGMTILSIVNDILDISKIESGKFEIYPAQYDTPSLINDIVTLNVVRIGEKPVAFKLIADENLPSTLYGDDLRVKQIFNNLLSNAFKYTDSGTVEWEISFEKDKDGVWIVSSIRDTGIGIKEESLKKLFADYNQVDIKSNRKVEGTGLGLAITKRLVEMMSGSITVESEYNKGSKFCVRFYQRLINDQPIGKEVADNLMGLRYTLSKQEHKKLSRANLSYAHVLVVDDIVTNLDVVKGMMKPYGMKVDCATGGKQAVMMIRAGEPKYDAIFMDHMMPEIDGIEATRIIREEIGTDYARNIPIIALTANAIVGNEEMFLQNGFQAFLPKPIDMTKMDAILRMWVRDKEKETKLLHQSDGTPENENTENGSFLSDIEIKGMEKEKALERFHGDEAVLLDVLRSFLTGTRTLLTSLSDYINADNYKDYAIAVHGIKGSSYAIYAQEIGKLAEELEMAAKAEDADKIKNKHPIFAALTEVFLDQLEKELVKLNIGVEKPLMDLPDLSLLEELRSACAAFDMDGVDKAMEQLESFRYKQGDDFIKWLREQVNHMDFEKISELDISDIPELQKKPAKKKIRILVINDSGIILRNAIGWLGDRYDVIPANSETMAMKYLSRNSADLILMNDIKTKEGEKQAYHTLFEELKSKGIPFAFVEGKWDKMKVTEAVVVLLKNM